MVAILDSTGAIGGLVTTKLTGVLGFSIINGNIFTVTETMVLGHYGYAELGLSLGYGFYQITDNLYNSMTDAQRRAMNSQFLDDCAALGANFIVEPNRVLIPYGFEKGSWLYYEILYLIEKGYQWLEDLSALVR